MHWLRRKLFSFNQLLLKPLVKPAFIGPSFSSLDIDKNRPTLFAIQHASRAAELIIDQEASKLGMLRLSTDATLPPSLRGKGTFSVYHKTGGLFNKRQSPSVPPALDTWAEYLKNQPPEMDIQIVPAAVFLVA